MRKTADIPLVFILCCLLFVSACERRPLDYDYYKGARVKVEIDWNDVSSYCPEHLKLVLYPESGGGPLSYYVEPAGGEISVPYGRYRVLFYNWRGNDDIQRIRFADEGRYDRVEAYTDFVGGGIYSGDVLAQPDSLFSWSTGPGFFVVSARDGDCNDITEEQVLRITPVSCVRRFEFTIPVTNLSCVRSAVATISGIARERRLYDGAVGTAACPMSVSMSAVSGSGNIRFRFTAFGWPPNMEHILNVTFTLVDGSRFEAVYDLTEEVEAGMIADIAVPIIIPDVPCPEDGGFTDPSIGDWQEEYDDILF